MTSLDGALSPCDRELEVEGEFKKSKMSASSSPVIT